MIYFVKNIQIRVHIKEKVSSLRRWNDGEIDDRSVKSNGKRRLTTGGKYLHLICPEPKFFVAWYN
jgi:hypothetical protein